MIHLAKLVGTGNDFLFVDAATDQERTSSERAQLAREVCDRHFGIGADGLVFVEKGEDGADFRWDFYNNDGSLAEMCGNAARCLGRWALVKTGRSRVGFDTLAGRVRTEAKLKTVSANIEYLRLEFRDLDFESNGRIGRAVLLNTGVPHAVVEIATIADARKSGSVIQALRYHPTTGERGTNVTFVARRPDGVIETVTFERGVEDFTLACGTGVLAAAAVCLRTSPDSTRPLKLMTPGGALTVKYGPNWTGAELEGPAEYLFDVEWKERK